MKVCSIDPKGNYTHFCPECEQADLRRDGKTGIETKLDCKCPKENK